MATTGAKFPTAAVAVSEAPWSDNAWDTAVTNVFADDGTTASCTAASFDSPDQTFVLKASGFDFSAIPDGSTVNGVTARINAWFRSGQGSGSLDLCQLLNTSLAKVGTNQAATPVPLTTTTTTIITKGSASDKWGNALDAAWVKHANFGIALGVLATAANADVDIDYVTLEIDYTAPAVPNQGSASGSISWAGSSTGTRTAAGLVAGTITLAGAVNGTTVHRGAGVGTVAWAGTATGAAPSVGPNEGTASGTVAWAGTATGVTVHGGSVSGATSRVGSATGSTTHAGGATGVLAWTGSAVGSVAHGGSVAGMATWVGVATGEAPSGEAPTAGPNSGAASGSATWAGSVVGTTIRRGSASGTIVWSGVATSIVAIDWDLPAIAKCHHDKIIIGRHGHPIITGRAQR